MFFKPGVRSEQVVAADGGGEGLGGLRDVEGERMTRLLQRGELAVEEGGRGEVAGARVEARGELCARAVKVDEFHAAGVGDELIAVGFLERGAGEDGVFAGGEAGVDVGAHGGEPRGAVGVGEGFTGGEFGDVGGRVKIVGIGKVPAEGVGEQAADGGFA